MIFKFGNSSRQMQLYPDVMTPQEYFTRLQSRLDSVDASGSLLRFGSPRKMSERPFIPFSNFFN